jgi:hypothetical protein
MSVLLLEVTADNCSEDGKMYNHWLKQFTRLFFTGILIILLLIPISILLSVEPRALFLVIIILLAIWRKQGLILPKLRRFGLMVGIVFGALMGLGFVAWWVTGNLNIFIGLLSIGIVFIIGALVLVD